MLIEWNLRQAYLERKCPAAGGGPYRPRVDSLGMLEEPLSPPAPEAASPRLTAVR